ncbi:hypothetical protein [Flavobacterium sp. A45]|uniref:DUF7946 domain-containing protein n=1 Tax=Flavobacterium sp. A45 TaxID=1945862 RepID=UPI000987C7DB|nr:hypothetical protein [Flavobacterium sp. A45]OOG62651.1 hypothetical protein B0E44_18305 [Flavobacterium sp. A45]
MPVEVKFTIRYTGGTADESILDLYDAASSMQGLAKALAITTHALATKGEIRSKGDSIPNVKFYLHPPKQGSFIELVTIVFEDPVAKVIGTSVVVAAFWDMIDFTWRQATGRQKDPEEKIARKIVEENELFPQEMSRVLEIPLQQLHRPILHDRNIEIEIKRPRVGTVLKFSSATLDYVMSQNDPELVENINGNVTKYNILSGYGRFYDDNAQRTIPFNISPTLEMEEQEILTWSLHHSTADNQNGKIIIDAQVVKDRLGNIKRYIIQHAEKNDFN